MPKRGRVTPDSPGHEQEAWEGNASLGEVQKPHRWSNPRSAELLSGDPRPHRSGDPTGATGRLTCRLLKLPLPVMEPRRFPDQCPGLWAAIHLPPTLIDDAPSTSPTRKDFFRAERQ